jgi:hypothetical protein
MQFYKIDRPPMSQGTRTIGVYEEYAVPDPVAGGNATANYKRIVGYFTLDELRAYGNAFLALATQLDTPQTPPSS